uniref:Uncharacterized protein n=1 Tax=Lactuca sativa TaxID=4236 RepID=A0A9R1VX91_LACSA|nr:hypothetical protein LSAT_V11C400203640 [Lactuca sativa]
MKDLVIEKGPNRGIDTNIILPKDALGKHFSCDFFIRKLKMTILMKKKSLVYSKELDKVFCFFYKLFITIQTKNNLAIKGIKSSKHLKDISILVLFNGLQDSLNSFNFDINYVRVIHWKSYIGNIKAIKTQFSKIKKPSKILSKIKDMQNLVLIPLKVIRHEILYKINLISKKLKSKKIFFNVVVKNLKRY